MLTKKRRISVTMSKPATVCQRVNWGRGELGLRKGGRRGNGGADQARACGTDTVDPRVGEMASEGDDEDADQSGGRDQAQDTSGSEHMLLVWRQTQEKRDYRGFGEPERDDVEYIADVEGLPWKLGKVGMLGRGFAIQA